MLDRQVLVVALTFSLAGAMAVHRAEQRANEGRVSEPLPCGGAQQDEQAATAFGTPELRKQSASLIIGLVNEWDPHEARRVGGSKHFDEGRWQDQAKLIRDRLGTCGVPHLFRQGKKRSRFYAQCEHGRMEVAPIINRKGLVRGALWGAQSVEPGPGVRDAAVAVLALQDEWDPKLAASLYPANKNLEPLRERLSTESRRLGSCEVSGVDLAGAHGAIFQLSCEHGTRSLKVSLDNEGKLRTTKYWPLRNKRPGTGEP
jgi:hypothetical protein